MSDGLNDFDKCSKIAIIAPIMARNINQLEEFDESFKLSLDLKDSINKWEQLRPQESYTDEEIEDFKRHLHEALISLKQALQVKSIRPLNDAEKERLMNVLNQIAACQDEIAHLVSL